MKFLVLLALMTGFSAQAADHVTKIKGFQARSMMQVLVSNAVPLTHNFPTEPNKETYTLVANSFYCQWSTPNNLPDGLTTYADCSWGWPGTIGGGVMSRGLPLAQQLYGYGKMAYAAGLPTIIINGVQCELKMKRLDYSCSVYWAD